MKTNRYRIYPKGLTNGFNVYGNRHTLSETHLETYIGNYCSSCIYLGHVKAIKVEVNDEDEFIFGSFGIAKDAKK